MEGITINVGCGERIYKEYPPGHKCINVDIRENLKNVDIISDVTDLKVFKDDYCDYILASDILEHFPISRTRDILKEWKRILKRGGIIEFRAPNLAYICTFYLQTQNAKKTSWMLYGGQGYKENFHYVGFDRKWLASICKECGLQEIDYKEDGPNFIMKVRKLQ